MSATPIILGHEGDQPLELDLDRLIGSHLGIVANSGGGKSGLIRKLLEVTHGRVQQIVLDSEDEFYTLRERHDYVIAGGDGGDIPATVDNAAQLAIGALTHGFSLICQINDLGRSGANEFIDRFLTAMIGAPKELWRPCLVVIDEVQRFDETAIGKLTGEGRKRGFTAVLATQRLPKMDANVRGDLNNWIMGRVGQSLDRRNMADQLGMAPSEARALAQIEPRHFYAFGPALSREPLLFRVGDVETTMVRPGQAKVHTPPPPEALREILSGLAAAPGDSGDEAGNMQAAMQDGSLADWATEDLIDELERRDPEWLKSHSEFQAAIADRDHWKAKAEHYNGCIEAAVRALGYRDIEEIGNKLEDQRFADGLKPAMLAGHEQHSEAVAAISPPDRKPQTGGSVTHGAAKGVTAGETAPGIPASQQRVLDAIAWWEAIGISPVERNRASVIAGLSPKASTFGVYVSKLAQAGLVDTSQPGAVALTDAGRAAANSPGKVNKRDVAMQARSMLKPAAAGVFDKILAHYPNWVRRDDLADECGLSRTASTLGVYISESSKLGFVETKPGMVRIAEWMIP